MMWLHLHRVLIGVLADSLSFIGGFILARDAFLRLKELKQRRLGDRFSRSFPALNLTDEEWKAAVHALRWTFAGFALLVAGFLLQLLLRFAEV